MKKMMLIMILFSIIAYYFIYSNTSIKFSKQNAEKILEKCQSKYSGNCYFVDDFLWKDIKNVGKLDFFRVEKNYERYAYFYFRDKNKDKCAVIEFIKQGNLKSQSFAYFFRCKNADTVKFGVG
jgi:hypothetical protein